MRIVLSAILALTLSGCSGAVPPNDTDTADNAGKVVRAVEIARGFETPWGLALLPDGGFLVSERNGGIKRVTNGVASPLTGLPDALAEGQGGRFDIVLHPMFAENQLVFMAYAEGTSKANHTAIARARLVGNELQDLKVIFKAGPDKGTSAHFGGRIAFLPDGTLLASIGEGYRHMKQAQTLDNHFGKIVRMDIDGKAPADNPFTADPNARPEIYSLGHRNPQGLVHDPVSGRIYAHEHGPRGGDEINLIRPGINYGWPKITYGIDYSGVKISELTQAPGLEQPLVYWVPSIAPSGMAIYHGERYPGWNGDLFVGALTGEHIRRVDLDDQGKIVAQEIILTGLGRVRDVRQGPDGYLYAAAEGEDGEGAIVRLELVSGTP